MLRRDSSPASGIRCRTRLVGTLGRLCTGRLIHMGLAVCLAGTLQNVVGADGLVHGVLPISQLVLGQNAAPIETPDNTNPGTVSNRFTRQPSSSAGNARSRLLPSFFGRKRQTSDVPTKMPSDPLQLDQQQQLADLMDPTRLRAKDYLDKGRVSLSQGNTSGAVAWYKRAAVENAQFGPDDYTPEQLRAELEAAGVHNLTDTSDNLQSPSIQPPAMTVSNFPSLVNTDPFAAPGATAPHPGTQIVPNPFALSRRLDEGSLPHVGAAAAALPPIGQMEFQTGRDVNTAPLTSRNNNENQRLLLKARLALAAGHVDRADDLVNQAKRAGVVSPMQRDTPQRVAELIGKYRQVEKTLSDIEPAESGYQLARLYMEQAEGLLAYGDFGASMQLAEQAESQQAVFDDEVPSPTQLIRRIRRAIVTNGQSERVGQDAPMPAPVPFGNNNGSGALGAGQGIGGRSGMIAAGASALSQPGSKKVAQAIYEPDNDRTRNELATAVGGEAVRGPDNAVQQIIQQGEQALADNELPIAKAHFLRALGQTDQLDPAQKQQLEDRLQMVNARSLSPQNLKEPSSLLEIEARQAIAWRQWVNEVAYQQRQAQRLGQEDPIAALDKLKDLRDRTSQSELSRSALQTLVARVDVSIGRLEKYIEENKAAIELDQQNRNVENEIQLERQQNVDAQQKLAELVEEFNELLEQERYSEAELLARQARQIDRENPVTELMLWKTKFIKHHAHNIQLKEQSQDGFMAVMGDVDAAGIPFDTDRPFQFGDLHDWNAIKERRGRSKRQSRYTEAELDIQRRLKTPVEVRFDNRPLHEVMSTLSSLAGVNIFLDPRGLGAEAITTNEPININLAGKPISLRSALQLILPPIGLNYVIQNEVLKITSEQMRDSNVFPRTYNVADLVTPIPNFNPTYHTGLPAALQAGNQTAFQSAQSLNYGLGRQAGNVPLASNTVPSTSPQSSTLLAQMMGPAMSPPGQSGGVRGPTGFGPGAPGGGAQADFQSLIELITTTIAPDSWDEVGGPGAIQEFEGNLSLVVSQTQDIHDQIADLLDQLRRLQDLQVTIEVRFIRLSDNFFERIGIDFDFDIEDNTGLDRAGALGAMNSDAGPSLTVGLDPGNNQLPTADLDLKFSQGSFGSSAPVFGGFDPMSAATFGFAILSDIEAFFVIQAAQGDSRSNIMQAPKVTLFNGQQATIMDVSQRPFVTSIIPVVGDFAAAHQPVITVLSAGTTLSVQAVVSPDRRFVRLTLVPFFSEIGDVRTFTFNGRTSSNSGTAAVDPSDETETVQDGLQTISQGTTVQLPEFIFTTVNTTVSVPDGGTVLLGGIKRLKEGRNERGVPMLNKLPFINRLFSNVGIGREASSLMLMVTPRIIIQEEEEELLLGGATP